MKKKKTRISSLPSLPRPDDSLNLGTQDRNRVDARVEEFDLNSAPMEYAALASRLDTPLLEQRNGNPVHACLRKAKHVINRKEAYDCPPNLGSCIRLKPLVRIRPKGPLCGYVSRMLKQRTDQSFRFLTKCQGLIKGTAFETDFLYLLATPYFRFARGMVMCYRTPNLGATRLIMQQILRCRSNFPWGRLEATGLGQVHNV
jgi:hypothetical protein